MKLTRTCRHLAWMLVAAAVIATAGTALGIGFILAQTKEELNLNYDVAVQDHGTGRVTVVLTLVDEGKLKPLDEVELAIPGKKRNSDGSFRMDLVVSIDMVKAEGGKRVGRVHVLRELAERAEIRLNTHTLDSNLDPLTRLHHVIPIAQYIQDALAKASASDAAGADTKAQADDARPWSETTHGLEARIALVEKAKINGTRSLVPYLELRSAGDSGAPLKVRCDGGHVTFELVGTDGKVVREGYVLPRSGPHADPGTIVLPHDSSIRLGMHCSNWGVPKDAPAMISTDSGAWVLQPQEKGKLFLRATVTGARLDSDPYATWHGTIVTPQVNVDWNE